MINSFTGRWYFLSNFYPCEIEYQGIKYPSVEHYYVSMKIKTNQIIFGTQMSYMDAREVISRLPTAGEAKKIGKLLNIRKDWDLVRLSTMEWGVREKFKKETLLEMLRSTNDDTIIEGNTWHDNFFGSCVCEKCGNKGKNNLGNILMKIRNESIE